MIHINDLTVELSTQAGSLLVLENLNLQVEPGDSCSIIGPSGCGKTTLLHVLAGLQEPTRGEVNLGYGTSEQALMLQDIGLFPWKTVWSNAILGLKLRGMNNLNPANQLLDELELQNKKSKYPRELSGGEKRRLGLVRALAVNPKILLMDEPLVSLDEFTRERLQSTILQLWKEQNLTLVVVTHDLEEAVFLGRRIAIMSQTPSSIQTILDNTRMGDKDFRNTDHFYNQVAKLRKRFS